MRLVITCLAALYASAIAGQTPGTLTAAGSMNVSRAEHSATLLMNGKILIAGGSGPAAFEPALDSAELYDPATGQFSWTGKMNRARRGHLATLLADGRVLIAGGFDQNGVVSTLEIWDLGSGQFTPVASLPGGPYPSSGRWPQGANLLPDGTVYLAAQPAALIFDPASGKLTSTSPYPFAPGSIYRSVTITDGRILLTGGTVDSSGFSGWTEIYDPATGFFTPEPPLPEWNNDPLARPLPSGKVFYFGDPENGGWLEETNIFDPATGTVTVGPNSLREHDDAPAILLPGGTVLVSGGQLPGGDGDIGNELYDPATGNWSLTGNLTTPRHAQNMTLLPDGTVLITGGYGVWPTSTASAEIYHPFSVVKAPALFSSSGDGTGQGAIWLSATGTLAAATSPAGAGQAISMYTTGLSDGSVIPPQVVIGGRMAHVLWFGGAPGYSGYYQVNVTVPEGIMGGDAVPVQLGYLGRWSNQVKISVH